MPACSILSLSLLLCLSTQQPLLGLYKEPPLHRIHRRSPLPSVFRPSSERVLVGPVLVPSLRFRTSSTVYTFFSVLAYCIQLPIMGFSTFHWERPQIPVLRFYPSKRFSRCVATPKTLIFCVGGRLRHPDPLVLGLCVSFPTCTA